MASSSSSFFFFWSFVLLGPHPWQMEVPRLGAESELQLQTYAIATATGNPSHICNSQQHRILNPLSEARGQTCILMDTSRVHVHRVTTAISLLLPKMGLGLGVEWALPGGESLDSFLIIACWKSHHPLSRSGHCPRR